jgi:hypothetical protein
MQIVTSKLDVDSGEVRLDKLPVARDLTLAYVLSAVAAALLLVTSIAGLAFGRRGLYVPDPATMPAFLGQDALSLIVGLPLLLGSMTRARRGSVGGLLVWMGALFYIAYSYAYYPLNPEFNPLYLAYITIVSASLYGLVYLLMSVNAAAVQASFSPRTPVRLIGGFMMVMALVLTLKWVSTIVGISAAGGSPTRVQLVVWPLDLIVALPALFWGGLWLWRRQPLGYVVTGLLLLKATFVGITLVVDTWLVTLWDQPIDPMLPAYAVIGFGGLFVTVTYLRSIRPRAALAKLEPS